MLAIYDRDYFKGKENLDGSFIESSDRDVRRLNYMWYMYATQHVLSYKKDFGWIEFIYKLEGKHIFSKPNFKADIVSGLGKYFEWDIRKK